MKEYLKTITTVVLIVNILPIVCTLLFFNDARPLLTGYLIGYVLNGVALIFLMFIYLLTWIFNENK